MRDFGREINAASEAALELPATEFSWSLSRHLLFNRCERAYFLHYYFAQGGWDIFADRIVQAVYEEKKKQTYGAWLSSATDSILKSCLDRIRFVKPALRLNLFRHLLEDRLLELEKETDSVSLCDFSLPSSDLRRKADYDLRCSFRFFMNTTIPGILLQQQQRNRINQNEAYEFYEGDTRIWLNPGIQWQEPGIRCTFRITYGSFSEEISRQSADLFAYYCFKNFQETSALSIVLGMDGPDWQEFHFMGDAGLGKDLLEDSMSRMRRKIRSGNVVYAADFHECGFPEICQACRYEQTCSILREMI